MNRCAYLVAHVFTWILLSFPFLQVVGQSPATTFITTAVSSKSEWRNTGMLPDTLYVGAGESFTSLTNDGGVFEAINEAQPGANGFTVIITSDLTESGKHWLQNYPSGGTGGPLKIITNTAVVKNINGEDVQHALSTLNNCRDVTIDGSVDGQGKFLRFISTHETAQRAEPCFFILENNNAIELKNLVIESNVRKPDDMPQWNNTGVIVLEEGNIGIIIRNNKISNPTGSPGYVSENMEIGIYASGNNVCKVIGNEISNFFQSGIYLGSTPDGCLIDSNHLFISSVVPMASYIECIYVGLSRGPNGPIISNNYIGGSEPYCGGQPWRYTPATAENTNIACIRVQPSENTGYIVNNKISNIYLSAPVGVNFTAISSFLGYQIIGNTIGDPEKPNSIVNATMTAVNGRYGTIGIDITTIGDMVIADNIIANMSATAEGGMAVLGMLVSGFDTTRLTIKSNRISNLSSEGASNHYFTKQFSVAGMVLEEYMGSEFNVLENEISHLRSTHALDTSIVAGIITYGYAYSDMRYNVFRNRIHNLESLTPNGYGEIVGLLLKGGTQTISNNQVTITNGSNTNSVRIAGIKDYYTDTATNTSSRIYYNSVYVGGTNAGSEGYSYGLLTDGKSIVQDCKNNLLYNARQGGSANGALAILSSNNWPAAVADYNFLVASDTAKVINWLGTGMVGLPVYQALSGSDASSYSELVESVPADSLFVDLAKGNLNISTSGDVCLVLNEKGIPVNDISGDYDSAQGVRSTSIASGPTDIGSDEFDPFAKPADLLVKHSPDNVNTLAAGVPAMLAYTIHNKGDLAGGEGVKVEIFLSQDNVLTPGSDVLIGTEVLAAAVAVNDSNTYSKEITIPCSVAPGTYTLFYVVDRENALVEPDENNNTDTATLIVTACTPPSGTENIEGLERLELGPNPTDGRVVVKLELSQLKQVQFRVSDQSGGRVMHLNAGERSGQFTQTIDLRGREGNIFYLQIMIGNQTITRKILVL